ncbi:MAG: fused MFS/spermidine synthase [Gallionella sp.]|jgi:spermidine synthase|nr:fused MFS/spermidine synthase [Gallionella sp.]MCK9354307.1 fused MFS/spermidine synthase [Gallionella sp.]
MQSDSFEKDVRKLKHRIEKLLGWTVESQTSLEPGKPHLEERNGILALHFGTSSIQSEMSIDAPDELVIPYTTDMMCFLLLDPTPASIGMIGLGGGSLAKYCYRHLPQSDITVVEIDPEVIALRNEFAIPADDARFRVLLGDGAEFVKSEAGRFDVLIADGYDAGGLPERLGSRQFYDDCFSALTEDGILAVNLWFGHERYDQSLDHLRASFDDRVVVVAADDNLNRVAFALKSDRFPPSAATVRHHANLLAAHALNFQAKSNKLIRALSSLSV